MTQRTRRTRTAPFIVVGIIVVFAIARQYAAHLPTTSNTVQDFVTLTLSVLYEAFPFLILGSFLAAIFQVYVSTDRLQRALPKHRLLRRLLLGLLGIALPVCECGNIPLARSLIQHKLSPADTFAFLFAAPILNPITIASTVSAFGSEPKIVVMRILGALIISQLIGWLYEKHTPETILTECFADYCEHQELVRTSGRFGRALQLAVEETSKLLPALLIGAIIAGVIQAAIPRSALLTLGSHPALSVAAMIVLAGIVSLCANVDAFFALAFSSTFSTGSLVAFLVFGPMIDIKILSLLRSTFKPRVLAEVTLIVALSTACLGMLINYV